MDGGELIREARKRAGLTQQELAMRLSTSQSVIARWESGRRSPTVATMSRALRACGFVMRPHLAPVDDRALGVALAMQRLTPAQRLEANRRMVRLRGLAREPSS